MGEVEGGLQDRLEVARAAAVDAGVVLQQWRDRFEVSKKGPRDLVTQADLASQKLVYERLTQAFPQDGFVGEEEEVAAGADAELCWYVDPLDGTTNYVHGIPFYCVSIGLARGDQPVLGVIHDPVSGVTYSGLQAGGAFRDGSPIRASAATEMGEALVAASLPVAVGAESREAQRFVDVTMASRAIRRLGSSALNLCFLAEGRFDAFWAGDVKSWDVAAGVVIAREAGVVLTQPGGGAWSLTSPPLAAAATPALQQALLRLM